MRVNKGRRRRGGPSATLVSSCILAIAGCAGSSPTPGNPAPVDAPPAVPRPASLVDTDTLTGAEIRETGATNMWEAVRLLRPLWLRGRAGPASVVSPQGEPPTVYVAGRYGSLQELTTMNVSQVRRAEFITSQDAATRFGTGPAGGMILVDLDRE